MDTPLMIRLLSSAVAVASKAGSEIRRICASGQLGVVDKGIEDFQTEADRTAQRLIVSNLIRRFPKCSVVGEEDLVDDEGADQKLLIDVVDQSVLEQTCPPEYSNIREEEVTIWIDPLDGTSEFVKGFLEHVTVLIGFSYKGESIAGVVHQPFYKKNATDSEFIGRTMWGMKGLGHFGLTTLKPIEDKLVITTTASHGNKVINDVIESLKPDEVLRVGGAGYKVLNVIEGKAHAYVFPSAGSKRWDTCAPEALLKSMGGHLGDIMGNEYEYNYNTLPHKDYQNYLGVLACSSKELYKELVSKIQVPAKQYLLEAQKEVLKVKF